jgi:hypothetical protein
VVLSAIRRTSTPRFLARSLNSLLPCLGAEDQEPKGRLLLFGSGLP